MTIHFFMIGSYLSLLSASELPGSLFEFIPRWEFNPMCYGLLFIFICVSEMRIITVRVIFSKFLTILIRLLNFSKPDPSAPFWVLNPPDTFAFSILMAVLLALSWWGTPSWSKDVKRQSQHLMMPFRSCRKSFPKWRHPRRAVLQAFPRKSSGPLCQAAPQTCSPHAWRRG